jgi:hypothetical protein
MQFNALTTFDKSLKKPLRQSGTFGRQNLPHRAPG